MRCIIIEDQPPAQRILKSYIDNVSYLELNATFDDALLALEYLKEHTIDLIFLDIHLPRISGIDFLKILPHPPKVILTTAFSDYALKGYELDVVDYLLKPFSFERFLKAVTKLELQQQVDVQNAPKDEHYVFVKSGHDFVKINIADIRYIKADGDYTQIVTPQRKYLVNHTLKYWLDQLPKKQFCQVHKSYLIQVKSVSKVSGNQLYLEEEIIPMGRAYKDKFVQDYLGGNILPS